MVGRRDPPSGTLLHEGCGDQGAFRWLETDLDSNPPTLMSCSAADAAAASEPLDPALRSAVRFPYHVSNSEAEVFVVAAYTTNCEL